MSSEVDRMTRKKTIKDGDQNDWHENHPLLSDKAHFSHTCEAFTQKDHILAQWKKSQQIEMKWNSMRCLSTQHKINLETYIAKVEGGDL